MNAERARQLTEQANRAEVDEAKTKVVLDLWHAAIDKAARAGRSLAYESELRVLRTPIPPSAKAEALARLTAEGFTVTTAAAGPHDGQTVVSW